MGMVFLGGSKSIDDITMMPNRMALDEPIFYHGNEIIIGDAPGADAAIQKYLAMRGFDNVTVYVSGPEGSPVRNNCGNWPVKYVEFDPALTGYDFYRQKDIQMILDCDRAIMAWDGRSKGTYQNIKELMALDKYMVNMQWLKEEDTWYYTDGSVDAVLLFGDDCHKEDFSLKLWLDDMRPAPKGYIWCKSVLEADFMLRTAEDNYIYIEEIDLDHDLGLYSRLGGDGIKLLDKLIEREKFHPVKLHTMNPVGRANMEELIRRYWR